MEDGQEYNGDASDSVNTDLMLMLVTLLVSTLVWESAQVRDDSFEKD